MIQETYLHLLASSEGELFAFLTMTSIYACFIRLAAPTLNVFLIIKPVESLSVRMMIPRTLANLLRRFIVSLLLNT